MNGVLDDFGATLSFLWQGLLMTILVSMLVVAASLVAGVLLGVGFGYGMAESIVRIRGLKKSFG
jgi:ABC-type amino acid transport system permease subunit